MKKITVITNQKGGVGKTTTTCSMAGGLSMRGYKVLAIDLDPQGNLSFSVGAEAGPQNVSLSPNSGSLPVGVWLTLRSTYSDPDGYQDLANCYLLLNTQLNAVNGVFLRYDTNTNRLYLRNDANTAWLGGVAPGVDEIIENSFCRLYAAQTTGTRSGTVRTVNWRIWLTSAMADKVVGAWMYVTDDPGLARGWDRRGTFTLAF
jgi:hypothetical protein